MKTADLDPKIQWCRPRMGRTQPETSPRRKLKGFNQPQAEASLEAEVPRVLNRTTGVRENRKEAVSTGLGSHHKKHRDQKEGGD